MSSVVLSGDSSGSVTLTVPSAAGSNTATVPAQTGTLEMLGQGTAVSASGTSVTFTSIPSWVKRITVMLNGVSTNGTSAILIRVGNSTLTTSGYVGVINTVAGASSGSATLSAGITVASSQSATSLIYGTYIFSYMGGNLWTCLGGCGQPDASRTYSTYGSIPLSGTLDIVGLTTANGTDTFDAGSLNILYEG